MSHVRQLTSRNLCHEESDKDKNSRVREELRLDFISYKNFHSLESPFLVKGIWQNDSNLILKLKCYEEMLDFEKQI